MKFDFSIESASERIQNTNTKKYFEEVHQTFNNGNYRSATVMLYSVLICDLTYKMRDLRDVYNDSKAKKILEEIENMQKINPKSPEWESRLIELIKERTSLLEASDIANIEFLQKQRHLSAHPVLNNADLLYSPNKETVQSLIRNILEGVLTNPPFFSNKIFDIMLQDLAEIKDKITDDESLEKYILSRYLKRLKETDFRKVFRSLWKVVFISEDDESARNRSINYSVLKIFVTHNKNVCIELLKNEPNYYSNINKDEHLSRLIRLSAYFPDFYKNFESSLKQLLNNKIALEDENRFVAWFTKESFKEHISSLDVENFEEIPYNSFCLMYELSINNGCENDLNNFAIDFYGESRSFYETQKRFDNLINDFNKVYTLEQICKLIEVSNNNYQIYKSYGIKYRIRNIAEKYEDKINKTLYPRIFE